ncbi:hypothetical protein ACHAW5_009532 [Stephanodiscus triporus]|uniref:Uncharacterized protein n=1 Tax=Stephanodiscus triporus TaxID=2934178 RepID=A0ABD3NAT6_9STRA
MAMMMTIFSSSTLPVQVATGVLCASYWRGAWYILDHTLFPEDRLLSGAASLASGSILLGMKQYIISPSYNGTKRLVRLLPPPTSTSLRRHYIKTNRFIVLYGIASGCILVWRGTWLLWDEAAHATADAIASHGRRGWSSSSSSSSSSSLAASPSAQAAPNAMIATAAITTKSPPNHHHHDIHHGESTVTQHEDMEGNALFYSGIASHVFATAGLLLMGRFACVMAPPANVTMVRDCFIHGEGKLFAKAARKFASHS